MPRASRPCRCRADDLGAALAPVPGRWVLFTAHRDARPWIGEIVAAEEPAVPADNALAPLGRRIDATNPDYRGVFVFTNDLPVFSPDAPEPALGDDLYRTRRAAGTAEVVCYHHDPTPSMADLTDDEVTAVVTHVARPHAGAPGSRTDVAHVLIFENRGAAVGTSNPAPALPDLCRVAGLRHHGARGRGRVRPPSANGRSLLRDVVDREVTGPRVVSEGEHFFACVPWFAQYAYEVHVLPREPATSLVDLDDDHCRSLGARPPRRRAALRRPVGLPPALRARGAPGTGRRPSRTTRSTSSCTRRCGRPAC